MPAWVLPVKTERLMIALALLPITMPKLEFCTRTLSNAASVRCPATPRPAGNDHHAELTGVAHCGIGDVEFAAANALLRDAARRAREIAVNQTVFDDDHAGGDDPTARDPDAVDAGVHAVEID